MRFFTFFRDLWDIRNRRRSEKGEEKTVMLMTGLRGESLRQYMAFFSSLRDYRRMFARAISEAIGRGKPIPADGLFAFRYTRGNISVTATPTSYKNYASGYLDVAVNCRNDVKLRKAIERVFASEGRELTTLATGYTYQIPAGPQHFVDNYRKFFSQYFS